MPLWNKAIDNFHSHPKRPAKATVRELIGLKSDTPLDEIMNMYVTEAAYQKLLMLTSEHWEIWLAAYWAKHGDT